MDTPWRIQLLGALRAEMGGSIVTRFRTQKTASLLARLALFPRRAHSREEMIDLLWPDADLDAGRLSLRVAIASLRRQLEPPSVPPGSILIADRNFVRLNPVAVICDAAEFEAALVKATSAVSPTEAQALLARAADIYHGELLPGFYDDWVIEERTRLTALYEDLCERQHEMPRSPRGEAPEGVRPSEAEAPTRLLGVPLQFTRFFGREDEIAHVTGLLRSPQTRLVTLTGAGGSGKTRLAGEVARQRAETGAGLVCFVSLADLTQAELIPAAIAEALTLAHVADKDPLDQVATALQGQPSPLLVLDNFEQLVERGASLVLSLLTRLPSLTCLVTSRRRLKLPGEREFPVPPLPLPDASGTPEQVIRAASAQLFVDRAQTARPDFQITRGNAAAIAELCRKLEGIPLAIELVAARALALTPGQMGERLAQSFALLSEAHPNGGQRHGSLWAAMAWSYDLIPPPLQRFFAGLSVFRGGCTVEAAQAVCDEPQALEFLTQLRERSLAVVEEGQTGLRFRLLETLREFAGEHLSPQEHRSQGRRHAAYFQSLSERMAALWSGPDQSAALETLDADVDNLRAALAFCHTIPLDGSGRDWDGGETGLRLAGALGHYWSTRGLLREGLNWLEGALAGVGSAQARARALTEVGWLAAGLGDYDKAQATLTEAITLSRALDDRSTLASALRRRGVAATWRGDCAHATLDLEEALALSREAGDDSVAAYALNSLGVLADEWLEDKAQARDLYEEALALFRKCGDLQRSSYCLHNLGNIAHTFGDNDQAEAMLHESLALTEAVGDLWHRAYCLRSLGDVAETRGDLVGAVQMLEEGRDLCRRLGDRLSEAGTVCSLASVARRQDDQAQAQALYEAALALYQDLGNSLGVAICRVSLAETALSQNQWLRTARLLAEANGGEVHSQKELLTRFDAAYHATRAALGPDAFDAIWREASSARAAA